MKNMCLFIKILIYSLYPNQRKGFFLIKKLKSLKTL